MKIIRIHLCTLRVYNLRAIKRLPLCIELKNNRFFLDDIAFNFSCFLDELLLDINRVISWSDAIKLTYSKYKYRGADIAYIYEIMKLKEILEKEKSMTNACITNLNLFLNRIDDEILRLI